MRKSLLIVLCIVGGFFFFFYEKKSITTSPQSINQTPVPIETKEEDPSHSQAKTNVLSQNETVENKLSNENVESSDEDPYIKKLDLLASDASDNKVAAALADIALNSTDIEKAKIIISQYGIRGYTAMSILIDRIALDQPEQAKSFVTKVLEEFKSMPSTDPQARMAVCGSLANLSNVDVSENVYRAIETEKDSLKRRCLFDIFTSNQNFSKDFTAKLISKAQSDEDDFIRKMGKVWKDNARILNSQEMQPYYSQINKEVP